MFRTVSDEAVEEAAARCEPAPREAVDLIVTGLTMDNSPLTNLADGVNAALACVEAQQHS